MDNATFDTIVVGARCAGASLATHLAKAGQKVLLLDAAKLPSDHPISRGGPPAPEKTNRPSPRSPTGSLASHCDPPRPKSRVVL